MLKKRILTSVCGLPILVAAIWFDEPLPWFTILVAVFGVLAAREFYQITLGSQMSFLTCLGIIWTFFFILSPHFNYDYLGSLLLAAALLLSLVALFFNRHKEGAYIRWAWTIIGILYIGWLLSYMVDLRLEAGRGWVIFTLATIFGSDSAAYFVGRALGKHFMAPRISPKKTWEGAAGGILGAVIAGVLAVYIFSLPLSYWEAVLLCIAVSVFAQIGDIAESLLKRIAGIKESGNLLPGHGGLLDRIDSIVFGGVVVYLYYICAVV